MEMSKKVQLTNDQVESWLNRITAKVDQQFSERIGDYESKTMAFLFEKLMQAIIKQLEQILSEEDDEDRGFVTSKDFMNDFATEEFLTKNIRVRPSEANNRNEEDGKGAEGGPGASRFGDHPTDEENQFNVAFELRQEREVIKKKYEAAVAAKKAEEERQKRLRRL